MPVHLLHNDAKSSDPFLVRQELDKLLSGIQREGNLNYTVYDLSVSGTSIHNVVTDALTIPFLGGRRTVVAKSVKSIEKAFRKKDDETSDTNEKEDDTDDELSGSTGDIVRAISQLKELPENALLIFVEENGHLDGRTAFYKELKKIGCRIFEAKGMWFDPASGKVNDAVEFIQKQATNLGIRMDTKAAERFAILVGSDRENILRELEKLSIYCGKGVSPSVHDIDNVVTPCYEAGIFHLMDVIGLGRTGEAMKLLSDLLDRGAAAPLILSMIARQIRLIARVREALGTGMKADKESLAKHLGESPFVIGKVLSQKNKFRQFYYPEILEHLMETDVHLKQGTMNPKLAMEILISYLANPR